MIRSALRELLGALVRGAGLPWLVRSTVARKRVTMVLYHDPSPERLEAHLRYLSTRYVFIRLDRLVDAIREGRWDSLPKKSLVVTFDDGHRGNYRLLPLFERFGLRPTIYLVSRVVGTERRFWFEHAGEACEALKALPNRERLSILEREHGFTPEKEYKGEERQALSRTEIREMREYVDFQSHSCFHPVLPTCEDAECEEEMRVAKEDLERMLGAECRHFAYPNGNYTQREVDLARRLGYRSARTTDVGWNGPQADPFRLRITGASDDASVNILAAQLTGLPALVRRVASWLTQRAPVGAR